MVTDISEYRKLKSTSASEGTKKEASQFTQKKRLEAQPLESVSTKTGRAGVNKEKTAKIYTRSKWHGDLSTQVLFFSLCSQATVPQPQLCERGDMFSCGEMESVRVLLMWEQETHGKGDDSWY